VKYDGEGVDLDYLMNRYPAPKAKVDRTLPGVSRVQTIEQRRDVEGGYETLKMWMPSCGGVNMGYKIGSENYKRTTPRGTVSKKGKRPASAQPGKGRKAAILKARPSPDALAWDVKGQWQ